MANEILNLENYDKVLSENGLFKLLKNKKGILKILNCAENIPTFPVNSAVLIVLTI